MPVHPEAEQLLAAIAEAGLPPTEELTVPAARASTAGFLELQGEPAALASVDARTLPGPAGAIPVRVYTPAGDGPLPVVVYLHGGGWVIGDLDVVDKPCRRIAASTGAIVVSVDYRLAPEHPYPAPFDDCYAATAWVAEHAAELGGDPARLAVAGDSAGGNLAAAVALAARDRGGPALSAQLLLYPVIDFNFGTPSYSDNAEGYLLNKASMQWFWAHYLGAQELGADPYICPGRSASLADLPPAYVATCEYDPLRDEGESYAQRLAADGVTVTARRYEGMPHGFLWMQAALPSTATVFEEMAGVLEAAWAGVAAVRP